MRFLARKRPLTPLANIITKKVLLLVDWDNLFLNLFAAFNQQINLARRLEAMQSWIQKEVGDLLGGYGFVFAPEHFSSIHQQMCVELSMRLMICPKRPLKKPKRHSKTGRMITEEDTVDETLISFGTMMMRHPDVGFVCLVSGDDDYVPLLEEAERQRVKRVLIPPTIDSLSKSKRLLMLTDKHPKTLRRMILRLDTL